MLECLIGQFSTPFEESRKVLNGRAIELRERGKEKINDKS